MKKEKYTTEQLLNIIKSYYILIQRGGEDFPAVVLDDIKKSVEYVLQKNDWRI